MKIIGFKIHDLPKNMPIHGLITQYSIEFSTDRYGFLFNTESLSHDYHRWIARVYSTKRVYVEII